MKCVSIDLSAEDKDTAVCVIEIINCTAAVSSPGNSCSDEDLKTLIQDAQVIGIDAPFGWPKLFRAVVGESFVTIDEYDKRNELRLRCTDRWLAEQFDKQVGRPTASSVSASLIAVPAWRAMALLHYFGAHADRSGAVGFGGKNFYEVYPAASLHHWGVERTRKEGRDRFSYKDKNENGLRKQMIAQIAKETGGPIPPTYSQSDHVLDALVAALTALAAYYKCIHLPKAHQVQDAEDEGWIHVPTCSLSVLSAKLNTPSNYA